MQGLLSSDVVDSSPRTPDVGPRLLLELPSRLEVFRSNLVDTLLFRSPPKVWVSSLPAPFWPDVFVTARVPWYRFRQSVIGHTFVLVALWAVLYHWIPIQQQAPTIQ